MNEHLRAFLLGSAGGAAKGILTYLIDKKIAVMQFIALTLLGGLMSLGISPFAKFATNDISLQTSMIFWGGSLATSVILLVEKTLPSILSVIMKQKGA